MRSRSNRRISRKRRITKKRTVKRKSSKRKHSIKGRYVGGGKLSNSQIKYYNELSDRLAKQEEADQKRWNEETIQFELEEAERIRDEKKAVELKKQSTLNSNAASFFPRDMTPMYDASTVPIYTSL
jgi:hypothetical protein